MTKIIRKTRKLRVLRLSMSLFLFFGICFLGSATLLKSYNVTLSANRQRIENEIKTLSEKKETLQLQVSELGSRPRIMAIAEEAGLQKNQDNIISVADSNSNNE